MMGLLRTRLVRNLDRLTGVAVGTASKWWDWVAGTVWGIHPAWGRFPLVLLAGVDVSSF